MYLWARGSTTEAMRSASSVVAQRGPSVVRYSTMALAMRRAKHSSPYTLRMRVNCDTLSAFNTSAAVGSPASSCFLNIQTIKFICSNDRYPINV